MLPMLSLLSDMWTYLQYEQITLATALGSKVTHKPDQSCFSTASFSHYHNWDVTPEYINILPLNQ